MIHSLVFSITPYESIFVDFFPELIVSCIKKSLLAYLFAWRQHITPNNNQ